MPPRAPILHRARPTTPSERFLARLDEHHAQLTRKAQDRSRSYQGARKRQETDEYLAVRAQFLASLGRLAAFEDASTRLGRCRFNGQLAAHTDELTRQYFVLRQVMGRHGVEPRPADEHGWRRLDYFATQLGRLEGLADAIAIAGRNVRRFPLPALPWLHLS